MSTELRRIVVAAGIALVAAIIPLSAGPALADGSVVFDPGLACSFGLRIDFAGQSTVNKTFVAPDGTVRLLAAGTGSDLVFTNLATGATYALKGNGAVSWTKIDSAGSIRLTVTGHNVLIYFPTDIPAGPSTELVIGREDIAIDGATGQFTRLSRSGKVVDICAALS